jgi:Xaa-Pro aminopeptidase
MLIREKVAQAVEILREYDVDCWLTFVRETGINGDPSLAFLVEGTLTWHSALIVTKSGETIAIVGRYDRKSVEDLGVYTRVIDFVEGIRAPLLETFRRLAPRSIALNFSPDSEICDGLTHGMYLTLMEMLGEVGLQDRVMQADKVVSALRQRKTPGELERIRRAIAVTEEIFAAAGGFIRPGVTEKEIAAFMKEGAERRDMPFAWDAAVCPAVFTGPDTASAHYAPTDRRVEDGHIVNMDFGLKYDGYCSDLQRTFYVLRKGEESAPQDVLHGFATVQSAVEESRRAMRPGVTGREVDAVARGIVVRGGFAEFPHGLGHQVGRFAHDGTALLGPPWEKYGIKPTIPLEERMVFTLEPSVSVPGRGNATIEEMVVVTTTGAEYLSTPQRSLICVPGL